MNFIDVYERSELPPLPPHSRYLDFIGRDKELRCFIVPQEMPRSIFKENHAHLLDDCLKPIYENKGIVVQQDASYPIPGFYIVSLTPHFNAFDKVDEQTHLRMFYLIREIRKGMREELNIPFIHLYYEEKPTQSCHVHYWLLPLYEQDKEIPTIYDIDIKAYLGSFLFSKNKNKIIECNEKIISYFKKIDLWVKDNELAKKISHYALVSDSL